MRVNRETEAVPFLRTASSRTTGPCPPELRLWAGAQISVSTVLAGVKARRTAATPRGLRP